jgi:hypothetical protein
MGTRTEGWRLGTIAVACVMALGTGARAGSDAKIEPKADQYLKQACGYLAGLKEFTVRVDETADEVDEDGQKLQFSNRRHITVSRPNRLAAEVSGDTANRKFFYDGKTVTLFDKAHNTYGSDPAPDTIDAMIDELHERFGYVQPVSELWFADPYKVLTEKVESGTYIGLNSVGDVKCHHLAFRQKGIDWQIWIDVGDKPLPRKLVMTYKREAGEPQYSAILAHWEVSPKLADGVFEFSPPEGARKVDLVKVRQETTTDKESSKK